MQVDYDVDNPVSLSGLAALWGWSRNKVTRFLRENGVEILYLGGQKNRYQKGRVTIQVRDECGANDGRVRLVDSKGFLAAKDECETKKGRVLDECEDTTKDPNTDPKRNKTYPDWLDMGLWREFKKMRTKIKKAPLTARAEELALKELAKLREQGHDPGKVIEQSILNCWKGLFPLRESPSDSIGGAKVTLTPEQIKRHKEHLANVRAGNV